MKQTNKEQEELFLAHEAALLAIIEECKNNNELAIASRELQIFEEEYYYEKENDYNE